MLHDLEYSRTSQKNQSLDIFNFILLLNNFCPPLQKLQMMAAAAFDFTRNWSLYSVPAAWLLSIAPHFYAASLGKFDNKNPRTYTREADSDQSISKGKLQPICMTLRSHLKADTAFVATKATIVRAEGAQQNGFENIGLFAAAVVIGNVAKLDNYTLNALAGSYLASRVAYNLLYINSTTDTAGKWLPCTA